MDLKCFNEKGCNILNDVDRFLLCHGIKWQGALSLHPSLVCQSVCMNGTPPTEGWSSL